MLTTRTAATALTRSLPLLCAGIGACFWLVAIAWLRPGWAESLLLLAPLTLVPLGLALLVNATEPRVLPWTGRALLAFQLPAAVVLTSAFTQAPGWLAATLTIPWLATTGLAALFGLQRLWQRGRAGLEEVCPDTGLFFLAVGAGWVILSRAGAEPLGFKEPIVLLTGVHFHYAGFILPLLTGLAGQVLRSRAARLAAAGVLVGVPLVALGITLSPRGIRVVEWLAAWLMTLVGLLVTGLQLQLARRSRRFTARLLFGVSGLALAAGMALAAVYALGTYLGQAWLSIPDMLPWHGAVNALGFALPGLLAWWIARKPI